MPSAIGKGPAPARPKMNEPRPTSERAAADRAAHELTHLGAQLLLGAGPNTFEALRLSIE